MGSTLGIWLVLSVLVAVVGGTLLLKARRVTKPATTSTAGWASVPSQPTSATWSAGTPAAQDPVAAGAPPMREVPAVWMPEAQPAQTWRPAD
jgi:hypothetical protein